MDVGKIAGSSADFLCIMKPWVNTVPHPTLFPGTDGAGCQEHIRHSGTPGGPGGAEVQRVQEVLRSTWESDGLGHRRTLGTAVIRACIPGHSYTECRMLTITPW